MTRIISWRQVLPTIVTILAMLAGFVSILVTFQAMQAGDVVVRATLFRRAAMLIMLSMILDGIDGNLARWLKGQSEFGAELDTYVDMLSFGVAPAILIFALTLKEGVAPELRAILPSAVALSGMVRLARFKVKDPLRGQGGYAGLPITANAAWVALFVFISQTPRALTTEGSPDLYSLRHGWFAALFLLGVTMFIVLQVSNLRYPKPTKKAALFGIILFLVASFLIGGILRQFKVALISCLVMIILGLGYVCLGPLFVKGLEVHKAKKKAKNHGAEQTAE